MSSGRRVEYPLKNLPGMISEHSGVPTEEIQRVINTIMRRVVDRARKQHEASAGLATASGDAAIELLVLQYTFRVLDSLLDDVDVEEIREARRLLGMSEKKLMN